MYSYAATESTFDVVFNAYMVGIITLLLAGTIAYYLSIMLTNALTANATEETNAQQSAEGMHSEDGDSKNRRLLDIDDNGVNFTTDHTLCGGLMSKFNSVRLKELESKLTRDQLEEERRIEREQLAAIFELLKKQEAELNMKEIDEDELTAQLNLYR